MKAIAERELGAFYQASGWPDSFADSAGPLLKRLGFSGLGDFRLAQTAADGRIAFRVAPERIFIRLPREGIMREAAAGLDLSLSPILELTGSRRVFRIGDAGILSRLAAVDFSPQEFPAGAFAQAECLGTGMLFHRAEESAFDVYAPRSWGDSFREFAETVGAMGENANENQHKE